MKKLPSLSLLAIGLMLFAGCQSSANLIKDHDEPNMDDTEVCYLQVGTYINIYEVDGVRLLGYKGRLYNPTNALGGRETRIIEFLPGSHTLAIRYSDSARRYSRGEPQVNFMGKPGQLYKIDPNVDRSRRRWHPQVVDVTNTEWGEKYILVPLRKDREKSK